MTGRLRCLAGAHSWYVLNVSWAGVYGARRFSHADCRCRRCGKADLVRDEGKYRRRMGGFYESLEPRRYLS